MPAFATGEDNSAATTTTVWTKAREIMQDVYSQIISISGELLASADTLLGTTTTEPILM